MADKILRKMKEKGISIYRLAQMTGIKYELVRRIFRANRKMSAEELVLILDKTGIAFDEIKWKKSRMAYSAQHGYYLVFFVCDNALPATLLLALLYRLSWRIFDAVEATLRLVCFLFAIHIPPYNKKYILQSTTKCIIPYFVG